MRDAAVGGMGIAFMSTWLAGDEIAKGQLRILPVKTPENDAQVTALWLVSRTFIKFLSVPASDPTPPICFPPLLSKERYVRLCRVSFFSRVAPLSYQLPVNRFLTQPIPQG